MKNFELGFYVFVLVFVAYTYYYPMSIERLLAIAIILLTTIAFLVVRLINALKQSNEQLAEINAKLGK
jgi:type VI protein secretion system component VasK